MIREFIGFNIKYIQFPDPKQSRDALVLFNIFQMFRIADCVLLATGIVSVDSVNDITLNTKMAVRVPTRPFLLKIYCPVLTQQPKAFCNGGTACFLRLIIPSTHID